MLHLVEQKIGIDLSRYIRPHQLPIGAAIFVLAPALQIIKLW